MRGTWIVGAIAVLLLAGCARMVGPVEEPDVSITSVRLLPAEGGVQRIEVGLRVMNTNSFPLKASGIVAQASFNDIRLVSGAIAEPPEIPAYGESQFPVQLSASMLSGIRLVRELVQHPDEPLRYRLEVRIDLKLPLSRRLTIVEDGEISARPPAPAREEETL